MAQGSKPRLGTPVNWAVGRTAGLVAAYEFNEGAGTIIHDSTGLYGDGAVQNPSTGLWEAGSRGVQLALSAASSQYVQVPNNANYSLGVEFTTEIWVLLNSNRNYNGLLTLTTGSGAEPFDGYIDGGGTLNQFFGSGGGASLDTTVSGIPAGVWLHIVFAVNIPSFAGGNLQYWRVYVNGTFQNGGTSSSSHLADGGQPIRIGNRNDNVTNLDGKVGTARIWQRALSDQEVAQQYFDPYGIYAQRKIFALKTASTGPLVITPSSAIPSRNAWFDPSISIPNLTVSPAAPIPSRNSWFTPSLNGSIKLAGPIPSRNSWPAPNVIVLEIAVGAPIPSRNSWPNPTITNAGQFINPGGNSGVRAAIPSRNAWPTPSVGGGDQNLRLLIGGIDLTDVSGFAPAGTGTNGAAATLTSQAIGRATATLDLCDTTGAFIPGIFPNAQALCGLTLKIVENGATLFAGCIDTANPDREMPFKGPPIITYHLIALDKTSICDRRYVTGKVYPAGTDIVSVILDVNANFLNGENIGTAGVPPFGSLGTLDADTSGQYETVRQMFDELATDAGCIWWIDEYSVLFFQPLTSLPSAPWDVDETDDSPPFRNSAGTAIVQNSVSGGSQTSGYRNKEYVVSNLNVLPDAGTGGSAAGLTETFIFTEGQPGIWDSPPGTPYGILTSLPIAQVTAMTVNGVTQTVYELSSFSGQTSSGAGDFLWAFLAGNNQLGPDFGPIPPGAAISVTYVPGNGTNAASVVVGSASNPLTPTGPTFGQCGSGVFEYADQVKNVSSTPSLNALAQSFLNRSGKIPQILTIETDKPGLKVGQSLSVNLPSCGIVAQAMVITQIMGTAQNGKLEFGSWWRWTVTAVNNYDPANYITYYSRIVARTENAVPVLQYESVSLVTSGSQALAAGVSLTNPYSVQRTGLFVDIRIAAATAPVNQNLVVQLLRNGSVIATAVLPAGSTPNVFLVTTPAAGNQLYLFQFDVLTWNVSYVFGGSGTPAKAVGVTCTARWSM